MPIVCCTQASHSDVTEARIRTRTLYGWKGPSLLIVNTRGECSRDEALSGYYFHETRFLRTLRLVREGAFPAPENYPTASVPIRTPRDVFERMAPYAEDSSESIVSKPASSCSSL